VDLGDSDSRALVMAGW